MEEAGSTIAGTKRAGASTGTERGTRRPRTTAGTSPCYVRQCILFDGESHLEPQVDSELGGTGGLTVLARVKRSKVGCAWDRLIDFGNGAEKENIVISYQQEMMYEVRTSDGSCASLAVGEQDSWGSGDSRAFPHDNWMQIALVHASNGMAYIFWNGTLKAQGHMPLPERMRRTKQFVGKSNWDSDPTFHGMISDLYIFDYALSPGDIYRCSISRSPPAGRRPPILSLGQEWKEIAPPLKLLNAPTCRVSAPCGGIGCGGLERCGLMGGGGGEPLTFVTTITEQQKMVVMDQLQQSLGKHAEEMAALNGQLTDAIRVGNHHAIDKLRTVLASAYDARHRAQAVVRMIRYSTRLPTSMREEATTGQLRQPPRIAAAIDPSSGMYHAFAIYELRSGDISRGSRFHVYVTDLMNLRTLLPTQTCWQPRVAGSLISLLQNKTDAEQQVVVLRALNDAERLQGYYNNIGFTSSRQAFVEAGLTESYCPGDLVYGHAMEASAGQPSRHDA